MKVRSFSHVGITVSDFNKAVKFYWEVFRCPLVGVADTPPERVRSFFGVQAEMPRCKIGWIRVPGGAVLEIFHFEPKQPPAAIPWNRVGLTHISFNVRNLQKWYDYLQCKGVECLSRPDGPSLHVLRPRLVRPARWMALQARAVQAVLHRNQKLRT